ncbi:MAG: fasciclin domain-containing protein, partial [Armatimonadetes bacterium]|nr:fasciclin domain-containing protein [Anaerolineae bacterium]
KEDLLADTVLLTDVLTYHIVDGAVLSDALSDGIEVTTLNGGIFTVGIADGVVTLTDANGRVSTVTAVDLEATNGVIHVIDTVLLPAME